MTPLMGGDGLTHAVAQGSVSVSGSSAQGQAESYSQGVPTAGRVPNGAIVELEAPPGDFGANGGALTLELRNPDFKTAVRVADAINAYTRQRSPGAVAREQDLHRVSDRHAARRHAYLASWPTSATSSSSPMHAGPRHHRRAHRAPW